MGIEAIDKNFKPSGISSTNLKWADAKNSPAKVYGVFYSKKDNAYLRYSFEEGEKIGLGYKVYADATSGGRIRFSTNADKIAFRVVGRIADGVISSAMTITNEYGVSVYKNNVFLGKFSAELKDVLKGLEDKDLSYFSGAVTANERLDGFREGKNLVYYSGEFTLKTDANDKSFNEITLFLPIYNGVKEVYIGTADNYEIKAPKDYKYDGYVMFYGSSITHGGCASRPGLDYVSLISQMVDTDVYNIGVTGSAHGEKSVCEYMAKCNPSVYVIDYDYNSKSPETLRETHFPLYETIRKAHKDTPIVFVSRVGKSTLQDTIERKAVILETVEKAKALGDNNVYFIDGTKIFPLEIEGNCTIDNCHPNDLGFYFMAKAIAPVLKEILDKQ